MAEPVKIITFGGAKFDQNQVASTTTVNKNGKTYYVVNFKTGAKVQYPAQAKTNNARIDVGPGESANHVGYCDDSKKMEQMYDNIIEGKPGYENFTGGEGVVMQVADKYTISQFWGLEFTGSKKPDDINLRGCTRCTIDVNGGNSLANDKVSLEKSEKFVSKHNEIRMDAKDKIIEVDKDTITNRVTGAGIHHEGDNREQLR